MSGISPPGTKLDASQVIRRAYDDAENRIRVDAEVTATIGTVDVILDAASDNVAIADPDGNFLEINPDGSINTNVNISHTDDSIRLGNGTDFITSTTTGPKVALDVNVLGGVATTKLTPSGETENVYDTNTVAVGATQTILTYTVAVEGVYIQTVYLSGTSIGEYRVKKNGATVMVYRMSQTEFSAVLQLATTTAWGIKTITGDIISVEVTNAGSSLATFDISLQNLLSA